MHFIGPVVLGVFLGLAASRAARRRFFYRHMHGGCDRFGHRGPFWMGGHGWGGFGGPRRMWWLFRELDLSHEQIVKLKNVWLDARGAVASVRASRFEAAHAAIGAALAEPFDKARLDDVARKLGDEQGKAAHDVADAIARGLEILTPEQRAKIRERFGRFGAGMGGGPDGGPYRSSPGYV
jgi:Spy/CpxP family protein refolding chaperone